MAPCFPAKSAKEGGKGLYSTAVPAPSYGPVAMVDAWDRQYGETYLEDPFPAEADTSGAGVVYYVMDPGNYELKNPMDISEYQSWYDSWLGSKAPIQISWQTLTEETIREVRNDA